jgi:hypothetical protein
VLWSGHLPGETERRAIDRETQGFDNVAWGFDRLAAAIVSTVDKSMRLPRKVIPREELNYLTALHEMRRERGEWSARYADDRRAESI